MAVVRQEEETDLSSLLRMQREQLARDLHDGVGSQLTHIVSKLEMLAYRHDDAKEQLVSLREFACETIRQLRESIWVLKQHDIRFGQLSERIKGLLLQISEDCEQTKIQIAVVGEQHLTIPSVVATTVFRIVQEAVTNSLKYAKASVISICLTCQDGVFRLQITDNGTGFNADQITPGDGLYNMRVRVEELSGKIHMISSSGFHIVAELPLNPEA